MIRQQLKMFALGLLASGTTALLVLGVFWPTSDDLDSALATAIGAEQGQRLFQSTEIPRPTSDGVSTPLGYGAAPDRAAVLASRLNALRRTAAVWTCVVVVLIGVGSFLAARRWTKPVEQFLDGLQRIGEGEGNLSQRVCVAGDSALVRAADGFNDFLARLQQTVLNVADNASDVSNSSAVLSTSASLVARGTGAITGRSASVAAAAEQLTTNMSNVAASTQQMSDSVKMVASAIEEMTASIDEVAKNAERAATAAADSSRIVGQSNTRIGELSAAAAEIGKVIEVIQEIAEQTNLLALNATIEASRAGDAGKGFAVVATEVKELAQQTAVATDDIRQRILRIQETTSDTVGSIGEIGNAIANVNEVSRIIASAVEEQSITIKEIARNIAQNSVALEQVAGGITDSASTSTEIAHSIAAVNEAIRGAAEGARQTQEASSRLIRIAEQLEGRVDGFQVAAEQFRAGHLKALHNLWVVKLTDLLSGSISLSPSDVTSPLQCKFGLWYQNEGVKQFGHLQVYKAIGEEHEAIHQAARDVVALFNSGQTDAAQDKLDELRETSARLGVLLEQLEQVAQAQTTGQA